MKATNLYIPSDEKPLEINGTNFLSKHFEFRSKLYKYSDIVSIKYFAEVNRTNYFITDRSNEFVLYLNIKENFPLENRLNKNIIDLSTSSFMGIGSGQITRDKISFMQEYLKKITFDTRVGLYLKQIISNGFFHYLGQYKASGYKIYNNGDIQKGDNIIVNILEAYKIKALQYGEYINSLLGLTSSSNPYLFIINHKKYKGLFSRSTEIELLYDKDIFDILLERLLRNGRFL